MCGGAPETEVIKDKEISKQKELRQQFPSAKNIDSGFGFFSNLSRTAYSWSYIINNVFISTKSVILQGLKPDTERSRLFCSAVEHFYPRNYAELYEDIYMNYYHRLVRQEKEKSAYPKYHKAECLEQKTTSDVLPIVLINDKRSINFVRKAGDKIPACVLRASDFLTKDGTGFRSIFYTVRDNGGAAAYLGIEVPIILSFIMDDDRCFGISPELAFLLIYGLRVSISTTFDTATYTNHRVMADCRMEQLRENNRRLVAWNPEIQFIGVVKGSYPKQIEDHILELRELGITKFIFHVGDFLCRGSWSEKKSMRLFAGIIRQHVSYFYIYGAGNRTVFDLVPCADGVITLSHIIETRNGIFTDTHGNTYRAGKFEENPSTVQISFAGDVVSNSRDMVYEAELTFNRIVREFEQSKQDALNIYQTDLLYYDTAISISSDYSAFCLHCQGCPAGWC